MSDEQFETLMQQLKTQTKGIELIIRQLTLIGWGVAIVILVAILAALFK